MTKDGAIGRIGLTWFVALIVWLVGAVYFTTSSSKSHAVPLVWELYGWSVLATGVAIALVMIWWWLD